LIKRGSKQIEPETGATIDTVESIMEDVTAYIGKQTR
jgi:hypothetical protein